jgi:hypothetical protein
VDEALAVLKRHGYTAGDLDFLLYEGGEALRATTTRSSERPSVYWAA